MAFIYDLSDTWNAGATTFTAIKMNVTDTASATGSKLIDLQINGTTRFDVDKNGQVEISAGTALLPSLATLGDTNTGMWFPAADTIAWSTGGSERLRITSAGNVGIGTTAPNALLSVNGIASFGAGAVATPSIAAFGDLNTGMWFPAADTVALSTGGVEAMRIDPVGSVGFGISAPQYKIDAIGFAYSFSSSSADNTNKTLRFGSRHYSNAEEAVAVMVAVQSATENLLSFGGGSGSFNTSTTVRFLTAENNTTVTGSERMRITGAGNIGIGTTAPNALLSVNGIASFGAGAVATPSIAAFGDINTGMWFPAADTIAWSTNGTERLRITSGGNLGLGTSTFGTSAAVTLAIATGTAPTTGPADTIQIYSTDLTAGNTMLSLYTEGTVVNANTTAATTHRIAIRVNGTVYYLLANTAA